MNMSRRMFSGGTKIRLDSSQIDFFHKNGYLLLPKVVEHSQVTKLRNQGQLLIHQFVDSLQMGQSVTTFSTKKQTSNQYFLDSSDKISFFWEPEAFQDAEKGILKPHLNRYHTINKIGHALHELDPVFSPFCLQSQWSSIARQLMNMEHPIIVQSMYIVKAPKLGGEVRPHQDSTFLNTKPLTCMAFWFPLEDVTTENACLWAAPGSHTSGIAERFRLTSDRTSTVMTPADPDQQAPWSDPEQLWSKTRFPEKWVPLECKKGDLALFHGSLLHMSEHNHSNSPRDVITFHVVDKAAQWAPDNWIQRSKPFTEFQLL